MHNGSPISLVLIGTNELVTGRSSSQVWRKLPVIRKSLGNVQVHRHSGMMVMVVVVMVVALGVRIKARVLSRTTHGMMGA